MKMFVLSFLIFGFIFNSCQIDPRIYTKSNLKFHLNNDSSVLLNNDFKLKEIKLNLSEENIRVSSIFELNSLIFLDSSKVIGDVDKVIYFDDKYYVFDRFKSEKIFCYNNSGKFLFNIGRKGRGPKEYYSLYDFFIDEWQKEVLIYDGKKVLYYDLNGNFKKSIRIDLFGKNLCVIDSAGTLLFCQGNTVYNKDLMYNIIAVDTTLQIRMMARPFKNIDTEKKLIPWYYFNQNKKQTYYFEPYNDTIYQINNLGVSARYLMNYERYSCNLSTKEDVALGKKKTPSGKMDHMTAVLQNDSTIFILNSKDTRWVFTLYDKESQESRSVVNQVNDLIAPGVPFFPKGIHGHDSFIVPIEPYLVHNLYNNLLKVWSEDEKQNFSQSKDFNTMVRILNNTSERSNPALAIVKVKNHFYEK